MTKKIGIRELARNIKILDEYDLIEIEDKKTKKSKGIFVSNKYADEIKKLIEEKEKREKEERLKRILKFAGSIEMEEDLVDKDIYTLREVAAKRKVGEE
ncbi:hypothetical protein [Nitrosophilus labii]|uniref:hypothetical protein n=1 Tax=Nitrosophilus labii TaxID=2706014 RepID=UPI0016574737|nr:hypothetical protein [Nitrosophilus labii]